MTPGPATHIEKDRHFVWHPFTHQLTAPDPVLVTRAEGLYYFDDNGRRYLDAISSWWVNLHGHCHPYISEKVSQQLFTLEHSMFSDFTHRPAIELAERLIGHLPGNQAKIFFSDNGSTAVEVGLKMALQYWHNRGAQRNRFIALDGAYHGDTFGGMSVGARNVFNQAFENLLFDVVHIPLPQTAGFDAVKREFDALLTSGTIAGFIFEPLVQGAAGMRMYDAALLDELIGLCNLHGVPCIADEVMTGFGRTGRFFASDHLNNKPDIVCMSKGLTGGYLPLGATSCSQQIYDAYLSPDKTKTFFHGHSYTANPTACAAALASLDLMETGSTQQSIRMISEMHRRFCSVVQRCSSVKEARCCGTILAIELKTTDGTYYLHEMAGTITRFFFERGIVLRPLGNVFYLIPPYVIGADELQQVYATITDFLTALEQGGV